MTIRREVEWGAVYPYAPEYVHPFTSREYAEAHARSTSSLLVKREWVEVESLVMNHMIHCLDERGTAIDFHSYGENPDD